MKGRLSKLLSVLLILQGCGLAPVGAAPGLIRPGLIRNGGFESAGYWSLSSGATLDRDQPFAGRASLKIVDETGGASQLVYNVVPGETLTISGWIRSQAVTAVNGDGYAFLAVYQLDAAGVMLEYRDAAHVQGTTGWTQYQSTFRVNPGAESLSVRLGLYNARGAAWYDEIRLDRGDQALSPTSAESGDHLSQNPYRAAILDEPALPIQGYSTPVAVFHRVLAEEGVPTAALNADQLADPQQFNADRFNLLVVPTGATFPAAARRSLLTFLGSGGDLLCSGGYAFDHLVVRSGGQWIASAELNLKAEQAARDVHNSLAPDPGFEHGGKGWTSTSPAACAIVQQGASEGKRCARVSSPEKLADARWGADLPLQPGKTYLVGADARIQGVQGPNFAFLAVYQYGAHKELLTFVDFAHLTGTAPWRRYEARVSVRPDAARVSFYAGLYRARGVLWLDRVTCAAIPTEERINAHFGTPEDGLTITPRQLTLFSPDQPLDAPPGSRLLPVGLAAGEDGYILSGASSPRNPAANRGQGLSRSITGYEATAQLEGDARWQPLLEARDPWDRPAGTVGALVSHFSGPFTGSDWALFGVEDGDVFAGRAGEEFLRRVVQILKSGVRAGPLESEYAIYHPGETIQLTLPVANRSQQQHIARVTLEIAPPGAGPLHTESQSVTLAPESGQTLAFTWRVPPDAPDLLALRATVQEDAQVLDRVESGCCVYSDRVRHQGCMVRFRDNTFEITPPGAAARRNMVFGTDTFGNMFSSPSSNPLTWSRDLDMMRDYGLDLFENLQFTPTDYHYTEKQWRQLDALVQLAQRFGLVYMAGLLIGQDVAVDDATLAQQAAMCRQFASRYRDVPGLVYYLNGDFELHWKDTPDLRRLWNEMLVRKYGTDTAYRKAWGAAAPRERLGQIPLENREPEGAYSVPARDVAAFKNLLVTRWVDAMTAAIRTQDRVHPVTAEYYQRPVDGIDLRLSCGALDSANFGYFGPTGEDRSALLAALEWNNKRLSGQGVSLGEFGALTHDAWTRNRGGSDYHVRRTPRELEELYRWVVSGALAVDASKIQNWDWSDDPGRVFPWGMAWNNPLRPKPVLKLYRNLHVFASRVQSEDPRKEVIKDLIVVLPDNFRLGAAPEFGHTALQDALQALIAAGVPFDTADARDLDRLPPFRLLLMPLAYGLSDGMVAALERRVRAGARVYLSGDVSRGAEGESRPERLQSLCGVRLVGAGREESGLTVPAVVPAGAVRETTPTGAVLYRRRLGRGEVFFSPLPWEAAAGAKRLVQQPTLAHALKDNLYLTLLQRAGVAAPARIMAGAGWQVMSRASGEDRLVSLFPPVTTSPPNPVSVQVRQPAVRIGTDAHVPCSLLLAPNGKVRAAVGDGSLRINGAPVARGAAPWTLVSLDGLPLQQSAAVGVSSMAGGAVWWGSKAQGLQAWVVERRAGRGVILGRAPLQRIGEGWEVRVPPDELVIAAQGPAAAQLYMSRD